jgi:hypothetical protein
MVGLAFVLDGPCVNCHNTLNVNVGDLYPTAFVAQDSPVTSDKQETFAETMLGVFLNPEMNVNDMLTVPEGVFNLS